MPHTTGRAYKSTAAHPKPAMAKTMPVRPAKPAQAGSRTAPSPKANAMAQARSHGQQGITMKALHAKSGVVTTPVIRPPGTPTRGRAAKAKR